MKIDTTQNFSNENFYDSITTKKSQKLNSEIFLQKNNSDSFSISDIAKRLNFNLQKSSSIEKTKKVENTNQLSKTGKKIDKIMEKAVDILERMQKLTQLAQDKNLTDSDRIEIQIEVENLRDNFDILPRNLITGENNSSKIDFESKFEEIFTSEFGDGSSILERMRTRITNGEKWNVREAYSPIGFNRINYDENGEEIFEHAEAGWFVVDDSKVISRDAKTNELYKSSKKVPTVRERLESQTPYLVMDAKSAEKSETLIKQRIENIQKWRENLPELEKELDDDESLLTQAFLFIDNIVSPNGMQSRSPLAPDIANYFYNGKEIYDDPMIFEQSSLTNENQQDLNINSKATTKHETE